MHPPYYVPVIHAAVPADRPDEQDTVDTALVVAGALRQLGYRSEVIDIGSDFAPLAPLAAQGPLAVFNLVEAVGGEGVRAVEPVLMMERQGLCYTGASASACALTASKVASKVLLAAMRIPTPRWWQEGGTVPEGTRVIVKSDSEHASLGIDAASIVDAGEAAAEIARRQQRFGGRFFAEEFIEGREFNVALIESAGGAEVLPIPEIVFDDLPAGRPRIVDYEAKWDPASHAYHHTPRRFGLEAREPALAAELACLARACWEAAGLTGYARIDFRVDGEGRPLVLEINTNPCLAPDAGFAATAAEAAIPFAALIDRIVRAAGTRARRAA
jgi:D-alanine-D-alanine ligase